ncbi:MAG: DegT/DnrJ/EryC1/StrS family aminotransferase [Armatimonadota bacterium]|nr:DegT/DnrJ/EryC1/StrS family aminotransferase [Armatimonadota bacterium]
MNIVGGIFALPIVQECNCRPSFMREDSILMSNGRSCIALVVEKLSPPNVWVPSYLCHTILSGIDANRVRFYPVNYDLKTNPDYWIDKVNKDDLVILIDYFGWLCSRDCIASIKSRGAWVLEDACQALLTNGVGELADFVVFSPRKFLGIPDGGILNSNAKNVSFGGIQLTCPSSDWWTKSLTSLVLRWEFDSNGGSRKWYDLYREVEAENKTAHHSMSELSRVLLMYAFDYNEIVKRRIENYLVLAEGLTEVALFPHLPEGVVPLGFPIRVHERDRIRETLFAQNIYPPVHWQISGVVPSEFNDSHRLAKDIMTIPCDQDTTLGIWNVLLAF